MISETELLEIFNSHVGETRKNDYVILPFNEFPVIDNRLREFEWYAIRLEKILSDKKAIVNYADKAIFIKL